MPLTNTEIDAAVPVAGEPSRALVNAALKEAAGDIASATSSIASAQSDISSAQSDLSTAQSDISAVQTSLSTAQSDISSLQSGQSSNDTEIAALQSAASNELTGTQGQKSGFGVSGDPAAYSDKHIATLTHTGEATQQDLRFPYSVTITGAGGFSDTGAIPLSIQVNGAGVAGLGAVSLGASEATTTVSVPVAANARISMTLGAATSGTPTSGAAFLYLTQTGLPT